LFHLGEDLSEGKDQSIIRRTLSKGEGWAKPNEGASVEVSLKGTHEQTVFDERTISFTVGEGFLQNIPEGYILPLPPPSNPTFQFAVSNKRSPK